MYFLKSLLIIINIIIYLFSVSLMNLLNLNYSIIKKRLPRFNQKLLNIHF
jgi:hypothetical protein